MANDTLAHDQIHLVLMCTLVPFLVRTNTSLQVTDHKKEKGSYKLDN